MDILSTNNYIKIQRHIKSLIKIEANGPDQKEISPINIDQNTGWVTFARFSIVFSGSRSSTAFFSEISSFLVLFSLAVILFLLSDTKLEDRFENLIEREESSSKILNNYNKNDVRIQTRVRSPTLKLTDLHVTR